MKRTPTKRPNWKHPGGSPGSNSPAAGGNTNPSYGGNVGNAAKDVLETFSITPEWIIIKAGDSYYAEYHGREWPEELDGGCEGEFS
jgi:hypothetical protein